MAASAREAVFELKPMGIADLLDAVIRLYRQHFGELIRIGAVVYVPLGVLQVISSALMFQGFDAQSPEPTFPAVTLAGGIGYGFFLLLFLLSIPLMQAAIAKAVAEIYLGGAPTIGSVYRFAFRRWWPLVAVAIITGLIGFVVTAIALAPLVGIAVAVGAFGDETAMTVGIVLAVVGLIAFLAALNAAVAITIRLFFGPLVVVLEEEGAVAALHRSWELTGGHFWRILIAIGILWLMVTVLTGVVVWPAQIGTYFLQEVSFSAAQAVLNGLSAFAQLFVQPIQIIGTVLLYYDLRMRKEGFDLVMMAEAIGEPELAVRATSGEALPALYGPAAAQAPPPPPESEADDEPEDTDQHL